MLLFAALQGVSTLRRSLRRKTKFFWESEDLARNRETWEIFREIQSSEVKHSESFRCFENVSHKIGQYSNLLGDFYVAVHMVLLKQRLLELSLPPPPPVCIGMLQSFGQGVNAMAVWVIRARNMNKIL